MNGPLHGFRVLDLSTMVAGPMAAMILADQGADVIKVERPGGDLTRELGPKRGGTSALFEATNRGKRSIALDLKDPQDRAVLWRLVPTADVLLHNFRPGVPESLGLSERTLTDLHPGLVVVSITGFGPTGPDASKPAYDPIIQAVSGLAAIQADRDGGRPRMMRTIVPDKVTALTAAQAITAALLCRERTGRGQSIDLAMLDAVVAFAWPEGMVRHTLLGEGVTDGRPGSTADLVYETRDGFITVSTVSDKEWRGLVEALDAPALGRDPRFATAAARVENADVRLRRVGEILARRTTEECLERLERHGVPCAPILSREDMIRQPQLAANGTLVESDHPRAGRIRQPRPAARFSATPARIRGFAPRLDEHGEELRRALDADHSL